MLNLNSFMIGTTRPEVLREFYTKILDRLPDLNDDENGVCGWMVGSAFLAVLKHSEMHGQTSDPGRLMFNLETTQVNEEFERMKGIGAVVVRSPYEIGGGLVATLADPDGNYFQLMTPIPLED